MPISSIALNQLVGGLAVATSQFQLGRSASDIFNGLHPFLPPPDETGGLSSIVDPIRRLASEDGTLAPNVAPEVLVGTFYEASRQLAQLTEETHPPLSRLADDFRQVWRRGLSHPPSAVNGSLAVDLREDDAQMVKRLSEFVENSPEPMGVVKCSPDGSAHMVLFNRLNRERSGLSEKDVAGIDVLRFFYPEDHDMVRGFIRECLTNGHSSRIGVRMLRRTGGHLIVDMYVGRVNASPYAYFQVIDETEREKALEQVKIRDAVFRNAGKPLLMLSFDEGGMPEGMVTSAGFDRMLGYKQGEIGTKPVIDFIPRASRLIFAERLREFRETGSLTWQAVELVCKDGSTVLVDIEANDSGVKDRRFAIVSFSDANARIAAERGALAGAKLQSMTQGAAQAAHDINNLMTIIYGGLQLLGMKHRDDEFLATMMTNAELVTAMLRSFRNMADSVEDEVDLTTLLDTSSIRLITPKAKDVEIVLNLSEDAWTVDGPNFAVWKFTHNIIKNAIESMEYAPQKRLTLATENVELSEGDLRGLDATGLFPDAHPGEFLKLSVEDTGTGMSPEVLEKIYDDFFSTKDSSEVGRGRGLNAAQQAVEKRGGLLAVKSEVGRGTTFEIYLPRFRNETTPTPTPTPSPTSAAATSMIDERWMSKGGEVVLVADDEADIRDQYAKILGKYYGYQEVLLARTTQEALALVESRPDISAVVTDWRMPGDTGDIYLNDLRALRPNLPILVNTGAIPGHRDLYPSVQFTTKLKGMTAVGRAIRRLIDGEPIDS